MEPHLAGDFACRPTADWHHHFDRGRTAILAHAAVVQQWFLPADHDNLAHNFFRKMELAGRQASLIERKWGYEKRGLFRLLLSSYRTLQFNSL